ncbi:metallophosphoesterase [Pseudoalteromonas sp. B131b]|uniref:metallophosphoesterase family protein n=1 Tax=Pseudoalteromonas sp. B131b TaxID=630493 RepID=UPI00301D5CB7
MDKLKFLIISDLHSSVGKEHCEDSKLTFNSDGTSGEHGNTFIQYLESLNQDFNFLVCPGDISNKGDVDGFKAGWSFINKIKNDLSIDTLLCVPGNHDHQSRPGTSFSAIHEIKFVTPSFPSESRKSNTHFWGWHWSHIEFDDCNIIKLNSSAYHGLNNEYRHGRVAIETSKQIRHYLESPKFEEKKFNILLCHHHPMKMEQVDSRFDEESMEGGQMLLNELEEADVGPWLIIHGHKHFANLTYGPSQTGEPPVIFSAGSLGANLYPEIENRTCNQFYIIEIDLLKTSSEERLVGKFEAYSWNLMKGWHPSECDHLPHKGGFGLKKVLKTFFKI